MDEKTYEILKDDKEKLIYEIVISSLGQDDLIYSLSENFKINLIKKFIVLDNPELICGTYCFITNIVEPTMLYEKALIQIKEKKFRNIIF